MTNKKNILILSPHTDDAELACGGTIYKLTQKKYNLFYIAFSSCEESIPKKFNKNILREEVKKSTSILGIKSENLDVLKYKVRNFNNYRQEILELLISFRNKHNPFLILTPSENDVHQDHKVIFEESQRAFKFSNLLSYELPWNIKNFNPKLYVELNKKHVGRKLKSLSQYKSQKFRKYFNTDFINSHLMFRGIQCDYKYAEAFEIININQDITIF